MTTNQPDFSKIILKLSNQGLTSRQIAQRVGTSHATIMRIKNTDLVPRYDVGSSLIILSRE